MKRQPWSFYQKTKKYQALRDHPNRTPCAWIRVLSAPKPLRQNSPSFLHFAGRLIDTLIICSADAPLLQLLVIGLIELLGGSIAFLIFS